MRYGPVLILTLTLAGCASTVKIPEEVKVPVPVPCVDAQDVPAPPPLHTEADLLAMDPYRRTVALWVDYVQLLVYKQKLEVITNRCSKIPALKLDAR